jgi:GT2 family glycosyltransferase
MTKTNLAIIITTYQRQDLLKTLLDSIAKQKLAPQKIYVVDNENSAETKKLVGGYKATKYIPMEENTGGAGGFSRGLEAAYAAGHDWFWVMDDDVKMLPGAMAKAAKWAAKTDADLLAGKPLSGVAGIYQIQRKNFDGTDFYWQYRFWNRLAIPNPIAPKGFKKGEKSRVMNTACFEGGLFHRAVVKTIGLPDARMFIYYDDTLYGYLASKITQELLVSDFCLRRTRRLEHLKLGKTRKLNSTSDTTRYYIMRNRGFAAQYLRLNHEYNPLVFSIGTAATFAKEIIRLFITKSFKSGFSQLWRGWRDSRKIIHDKTWQPFSEIKKL